MNVYLSIYASGILPAYPFSHITASPTMSFSRSLSRSEQGESESVDPRTLTLMIVKHVLRPRLGKTQQIMFNHIPGMTSQPAF
jgi:hypothetical protein